MDLVGNKNPPAAASIIVDTTSPSKVTDLVAVDTPDDNGNAITLSWTSNTETDLFQYNIYRSEGPVSNVNMLKALYSTMRNSYVDNTTIDGIDYYYAVTAIDNCGNEDKEVIDAGPVSSMDNMYY